MRGQQNLKNHCKDLCWEKNITEITQTDVKIKICQILPPPPHPTPPQKKRRYITYSANIKQIFTVKKCVSLKIILHKNYNGDWKMQFQTQTDPSEKSPLEYKNVGKTS